MTIELTYRYSELDKVYEAGSDYEHPMFWFELGLALQKSKISHLVNKCADVGVQVFPYSISFAVGCKTKKIKGEDCEELAVKACKLIEKFVTDEANKNNKN